VGFCVAVSVGAATSGASETSLVEVALGGTALAVELGGNGVWVTVAVLADTVALDVGVFVGTSVVVDVAVAVAVLVAVRVAEAVAVAVRVGVLVTVGVSVGGQTNAPVKIAGEPVPQADCARSSGRSTGWKAATVVATSSGTRIRPRQRNRDTTRNHLPHVQRRLCACWLLPLHRA
jgi:hypothetical protein